MQLPNEYTYMQTTQPLTTESIQSWLINNVAELLEMSADEVDLQEPFHSFGLSSLDEVTLSGDLEGWLNIKLSPTITWDYPTIEVLSKYLAERVKATC